MFTSKPRRLPPSDREVRDIDRRRSGKRATIERRQARLAKWRANG